MHDSFQGTESDDLRRHPAAEAWRRLQPHSTVPTRVDLIGDKRSLERKIEIFRLTLESSESVGLSVVVAKRLSTESCLAEYRSYEILAHRSVSCLKCYGYVAEGEDECWLFLEDAGGETFNSTSDRHRLSAYDWIARMHVETARGREHHPRDRGVDYYGQVCSTSRKHLLSALHRGAFEAEDTHTLNALVAALRELEAQWGHLRLACDRVPQSLTHNALLDRNFRVREHRGEVDFVAFDWERSGWGSPALDIGRLVGWAPEEGVHEYWRRVRSAWSGVSADDVERLAVTGSLFKLIQSVAWDASYIERDWYPRPLTTLEIYRKRLEQDLATLAAWK